jgi:hypothetical protein
MLGHHCQGAFSRSGPVRILLDVHHAACKDQEPGISWESCLRNLSETQPAKEQNQNIHASIVQQALLQSCVHTGRLVGPATTCALPHYTLPMYHMSVPLPAGLCLTCWHG